jgi:hypothetical protein
MLTKEGMAFLLHITDYFNGHWEDPDWGTRPVNQLLVLATAHTLANAIEEPESRAQIQSTVERAMAKTAMQVAKK